MPAESPGRTGAGPSRPAPPAELIKFYDDDEALEAHAGVEVIRWPRDTMLRQWLARACVPRLLLVDRGSQVPELGVDEAVLPGDSSPEEIRNGAEALAATCAALDAERPWIDEHRVLHRGPVERHLSEREAALLQVLLDRAGTVVPRDEIERAVFPSGAPSDHGLPSVLNRLRRRLIGLRLYIHGTRMRGLTIAAPGPPPGDEDVPSD
jgi:hypothetical protein